MGYFSNLAIELLDRNSDRELSMYDEDDCDSKKTNQDLAREQQEEQYSIWNELYRRQLEQQATSKEQPKTYKKIRGSK